ncbi:MAG TPA: DinB family protein [Bryobacteraceae bacterium]|nr:DinB family protein [Bryobacteraceae bacterium]
MPVSADTLRLHLDYSAWASQRLLDAAAQLSPEELTRDFKTADSSVLGTLVHVFGADRIWLQRIQGNPRATFLDPEDRDFARLREAWPALLQRWKEWAAPLTDERAAAKVAFRDMRGNPYEMPLWQILLHVVNHGTHHRGQVSGFLRSMGHTPPELDLIAYYRTLTVAEGTAAS